MIDRKFLPVSLLALLLAWSLLPAQENKTGAIQVDKEKGQVRIDALVAPRKVYKDQIYPIEVIASWPHPKGKKAHETVVTIDVNPSDVHKALMTLGLQPGAPLMGDAGEKEPQGPEVNLFLEIPGIDGPKKLTMDKILQDINTRKPFPKSIRFRFTGSAEVEDPASKNKSYGADQSGTLAVIFPVTNLTVMQTNLTIKYESAMKLETNTKSLPREGTPVKLVIEVVK